MWHERIATVCLLVMESLVWFVLAAVMAGGAGGAGPAYITVLLAVLGGFWLARGLQRFDLQPKTLAMIGGVLSLIALTVLLNLQYNPGGSPLSLGWLTGFVAAPDEYLRPRWPATWGVLFVAAAWARAVQVAHQELRYRLALGSFSVGLGVIVVTLLLGQASRVEDAINNAALPFFIAGLLTLALVHLHRAGPRAAEIVRGPWLPVMIGTIVGLVVVSAAIGLFPLDLLNRLLAPLGVLALLILDVVILLIALPIGWLVGQLLKLIYGPDGPTPPEPNRLASETAERFQQGDPPAVIAFFLLVFKLLFLLLLAALVAYVVYRVFRRLRRPASAEVEVRESVYREGGLSEDLGALTRGLLGRFRRADTAREPALPPPILRLRRLYLRVLDDAAARGTARPPAATPHEFAPELARTFGTPAPARLSDRFAAARYGRVEPSADELRALERELGELRRTQP